jgi:tRNA threonylcarbamoyladenosine biosynthesis protein TsaE
MTVWKHAKIALPTRRATIRLGWWLADRLHPGDLVVLSGDLGAGKTFLSRAVARRLGVPCDVRVTSPTFTLVHQYPTESTTLLHVDLYRIEESAELDQLGLREARADGAVLLVEWGKPFVHDLGGDALVVELALEPSGRSATLQATGPASARIVTAARGFAATASSPGAGGRS